MAVLRTINPSTIASSASNYSQAVLVEPNVRTLYVSGQLGMDRGGVVLAGFHAQMQQAMANLFAVLEDVGMTRSDIVKLTVFSADPSEAAIQSYRTVRDTMLGDHAPAALYASVTGFTHPDFLVEVEAVAAAAI